MICHNEIWDFTATLMMEVCTNVSIESSLQRLNGEQLMGASENKEDGARLDIATDGFWGTSKERAFFDIRVFNPYAPTNRQTTIVSTYKMHEEEKKRQYGQCIREVEHSTFIPMVLSWTGEMGKEALSCYKHLASLLSTK